MKGELAWLVDRFVHGKQREVLDNVDSIVSRIEELKRKIGNTPLELIDIVNGNPIYAKLEYYNPLSYSIKDRAAVHMFEGALNDGKINSDENVFIEASSGNLGIAYGKVGNFLGLKTMIVLPSIVGETTHKRVNKTGAMNEICPDSYCPIRGEKDGAIRRVYDIWLSDVKKYKWLDQYSNPNNIRAHKEGTGPELWKQTKGKITTLVVATGTGGTIIGSSLYLKKQNPEIKIVAVQPQKGHHIQGTRNFEESMKPVIIEENEDLIDNWKEIDDKEALDATKHLWRRGYPVGTSSSLNYVASRKIARKEKNSLIVTLFPDTWTNSFKLMQNYLLNERI